MPEISVIVPVYKVEPFIHRCIDRILTQTYRDFELILVDDGSPDQCGAICDEYAEKDDRIIVIHQSNQGLSAARNAGIDYLFSGSSSQWICFVDSDDYVHPMYLEALHKSVVESGLDVGACDFINSGDFNYEMTEEGIAWKYYDAETFFFEWQRVFNLAWGKIYKKNCFKEIRYPVGKVHEDMFVTYKIIFEHEGVAYIPQSLYFYYHNPDGIMRSDWTPKRMAAFDGYEEEISYFCALGKETITEYILKRMLYLYCTLQKQLQQNKGPDYKKHISLISGRMKETLRTHKQLVKKCFSKKQIFKFNCYAISNPVLKHWILGGSSLPLMSFLKNNGH